MVGVQSNKVRLWGGVLYILKSGDITCSGEVIRGDWTPDWTPPPPPPYVGQFYIVSDTHLKHTVSHVSYICMNKTQSHSESFVILLYDYKTSSQ